jgi:membrane fusion protein, multidrug efflux system
MTPVARRSLVAGIAFAVLVTAVRWLSGGCGERIAPGEVEPKDAAGIAPHAVAAEERSGTSYEWASGEIASARHTAVSSRVLARIEQVRVRAGSTVAVGDVLVVLDARDLGARVGEADEALRAARARRDLARTEHTRAEELYRSGVGSQQRLEQAESGLRSANADVAAREQALAAMQTGKSFAEIRSPVAGRVVDRLAEPGDTAVPGQPLMRIYDPSLLRVEVPVRESLAVGLEVGGALRVEIPALGETLDARIDELVPFAEPGARTLLVKARLPRTDARLFSGMFARVGIPAGMRRRLVVPAAAVERIGQLEFVDVVAGGAAPERRLVTTGEETAPGEIEILSGLAAGERVRVPEAPAGVSTS